MQLTRYHGVFALHRLQLALFCEHAQWLLDRAGDRRGVAAALRYSRLPVDLMHESDPELDRVLLGPG